MNIKKSLIHCLTALRSMKTKKALLLFILFLIVLAGIEAQSFEGKITYQNTYKSKLPSVSSEQFTAMMGNTQEYFIKSDKYKSVTNGSFSQWQLYVPSENRLYSKMSISDTLLWSDGSVNPDPMVSYEIKKGQGEVLGYKCDALVVKTKMGQVTYYFSKKIKVDASLYRNHEYGNWALLTGQANSLPLKIEMETPQFTLVSEAIEVKDMELEDSLFDLPEVQAKKSPY